MNDAERTMLRAVEGRVHHRETFGTVDGPGLRYVLFLQGCPLRCLYCHNPDSISPAGGQLLTAGEVVDEILRYKSYYTNGGVTISGGEPLLQPEFVTAVELLLEDKGLATAIDTAGVPLTGGVEEALEHAALVLLDIKAYDSETAKRLSGRDNRISFAMLDYCEEKGIAVWVRHVLLRGYTLDEKQLTALAQRLTKYSCIQRVELLPFHKMGEPKWLQTGMEYTLPDVEATSKAEAAWARDIFAAAGLCVQ